MRRATAVKLGLATFGLVLAGFLVVGLGRLVVGRRTALLVGGPVLTLAAILACGLVVLFSLDVLGAWRLEREE